MSIFSGTVAQGYDCKIPLGNGKFSKIIRSRDTKELLKLDPETKLIFDFYCLYVDSGYNTLMLGGGAYNQPSMFWEMDKIYKMIKNESSKLKNEIGNVKRN